MYSTKGGAAKVDVIGAVWDFTMINSSPTLGANPRTTCTFPDKGTAVFAL